MSKANKNADFYAAVSAIARFIEQADSSLDPLADRENETRAAVTLPYTQTYLERVYQDDSDT